ncbi:glutamate receptor ionotropic, kainate 1 [Trichonephila inaurata madagascariensis]|uniref:Glutamate receptor ionotropic, kainate 1 n=1 Tax=Trichonephila inaurata madagascariensis TaxID=2747483 RepID=A0A8X6M9R1_9ARAC|nr:glutamate receptor ionotropic, kainate 1 [Trichonephila inaurata madagascariensis]
MKNARFRKKVRAVLPPSKSIYVSKQSIKGVANIPAIEARFLHLVSESMGFDYELMVPGDGFFGHELDNGSWTGIVGMLHRNEADMAFAYLSMNYDRYQVVDFSTIYTTQVQTFVTEMPALIPKMWVLIYPFDLGVWLGLLFLLPLASFIIYYFMRKKKSFSTVLTVAVGSIFKQSAKLRNQTASFIILYCFWWLFVTFITMGYSAVFLSFLTVPLREKGVQTVLELCHAARAKTFKALMPKGSFLLEYLLESEHYHLHELGRIINESDWFYDTREPITTYFGARNALIGPKMRFIGSLYYKKKVSEDSFGIWNVGVVLSRQFCCKERLNKVVMKLLSGGLYQKIVSDEVFRSGLGADPDVFHTEQTHSLSLEDMYAVFLLLFVGYLLSLISLIGEMMFRYYANKLKI